MYAAGAPRGRGRDGGGTAPGEWTSLENEGNGRSDELRRNSQAEFGEVQRDGGGGRGGGVQNPGMIPGADRVFGYD